MFSLVLLVVDTALSGTYVAVFGTITSPSVSPTNPASTYTIDGSDVATFAPTEDNAVHYRQLFFYSSRLASGSHTLVITSTVDNAYFFLDYIQFTSSSNASLTTQPTTTTTTPQGQTPNSNQTTTSVTLTTSSQTQTQITTITPSQGSLSSSIPIITQGSDTLVSSTSSQSLNLTPSHSSNPTPSRSSSFSVSAPSVASSRSSKTSVGAIAGGTIAAAAIVVIAVIVFCLIQRFRRRTGQGWQHSSSQLIPFRNTARSGSDSIPEGAAHYPIVGLHNGAVSSPMHRKTLHNIPIPPGLQPTPSTTETPDHSQDQEVASGADADSPPEYDYGESTRLWKYSSTDSRDRDGLQIHHAFFASCFVLAVCTTAFKLLWAHSSMAVFFENDCSVYPLDILGWWSADVDAIFVEFTKRSWTTIWQLLYYLHVVDQLAAWAPWVFWTRNSSKFVIYKCSPEEM